MIGDACIKSNALPLGIFSVCGTSSKTTSPSSAEAHQCAQVAPTFPAPIIVIFARRIRYGLDSCVEDYEQLNESTKYGDIGVTVKWIIYRKSVRERRSQGWVGQKMQIDKDTADKGAGTLRRAVRDQSSRHAPPCRSRQK